MSRVAPAMLVACALACSLAPIGPLAPRAWADPQPLDAPGNEINEGQASDSSFLYDAAIADLAGADAYYDGQTVQVTGEVVGEAITEARMPFSGGAGGGSDSGASGAFAADAQAGDAAQFVWVTLFEASSGSSVTVFMDADNLAKIDSFGAYGKTGTILSVQGTFNLACKEHAGESDIHASSVVALESGSASADEFDARKFVPGIVVVAAGAALALVFWRMKERSR